MIRQPLHPHAVAVAIQTIALLSALGGCKKNVSVPDAAASQPSASASASPAEDARHTVSVDPGLIQSGRVQVKPAEKRALADEALASGEVVPAVDGQAEIGALVAGRVSSILVKEGDKVKAGQVLAWIDAPEAARMQGDWIRARARVWRSEKVVAQERALWAEKATSERALQTAEAELREAQAEERASFNLLVASRVPVPKEAAKGGAARIPITTPIAGVVSKRSAILGGHVASDSSLFEVVAPEKLIVRANVAEVLARRVEIGGPAAVRMRGSEQTCAGTIQSRLDRIDEQRRTMGVMVSLAKDCPPFVSGAFVDVTVSLSATGAPGQVVVPRSAIVEFDGAPAVFVHDPAKGPGDFAIHVVRLGHTDGTNTVVEEGLKDGEPVAVVGALLLKGEHIRKDLGGE